MTLYEFVAKLDSTVSWRDFLLKRLLRGFSKEVGLDEDLVAGVNIVSEFFREIYYASK